MAEYNDPGMVYDAGGTNTKARFGLRPISGEKVGLDSLCDERLDAGSMIGVGAEIFSGRSSA